MAVDWHARLKLNATSFAQGEDLKITGKFGVDSRMIEERLSEFEGARLVLSAERLFDAGGRYHQNSNVFMSTVMTPTGFPIENNQPVVPSGTLGNVYTSPIDLVAEIDLSDLNFRRGRADVPVQFATAVPAEMPDGYYRLNLQAFIQQSGSFYLMNRLDWIYKSHEFKIDSLPFVPGLLNVRDWHKAAHPKDHIGLIRIGEPAAPKMIWTLRPVEYANGIAGIVADEDRLHFQLSSRTRFDAKTILGRGTYTIAPDFPTLKVGPAGGSSEAAVIFTDTNSTISRFDRGKIFVSVRDPAGVVHELGSGPLVEETPGGASAAPGRFDFAFDHWGEYAVSMTGWMEDQQGIRFQGGGTYRLWVARKISFSTSDKPGLPYFVGEKYIGKVDVHPTFPATVTVAIDHYPYSDVDRKISVHHSGRANRFGRFSPAPSERLQFQDPGEYRVSVEAQYTDSSGVLWLGHQQGASVVAHEDSTFKAHGMKFAHLTPADGDLGLRARFNSRSEGTMSMHYDDIDNCHEFSVPYFSGDVGILPVNGGRNNFYARMSFTSTEPAIQQLVDEKFPLGVHSMYHYKYANRDLWDLPQGPVRDFMAMTPGPVPAPLAWSRAETREQGPLLSLADRDWHPFEYPESSYLQSYYYFTSIKPGYTSFTLIGDSSTWEPYWETAADGGAAQINAAKRNDSPLDVYQFHGGVVYRDKRTNTNRYGVYASMGLATRGGIYDSGVFAPGERPLVNVSGRDHWVFLGLEAAGLYQVGDYKGMGAMVMPPVEADVSFTLIRPDGTTKTELRRANGLGKVFFPSLVERLARPGVYLVKTHADYQGKTGDLVGTGDGIFPFYVLPQTHDNEFVIDLPPMFEIDATKTLEIPLVVGSGVTSATVHYTTLMPGIIMDRGALPVVDGRASLRFRPIDAHMQFQNFDIMPDDHALFDSVFFVFFLEGRDAAGQPVYDAHQLMLRGPMVINLDSGRDVKYDPPIARRPSVSSRNPTY